MKKFYLLFLMTLFSLFLGAKTVTDVSIGLEADDTSGEQPGYTMVVAPADGDVLTEALSAITVSCDDGIDTNVSLYFQVKDKAGNVVAGVWNAVAKETTADGQRSYSLPLYDDDIFTEDVSVTLSDPGEYTFTIPAGAFYLAGDHSNLSEETTIKFTIVEASEPEPDYTLTFDPADNAELDQLDYMTISCAGGIVLGTTWKDEVLFDVYDEGGNSIGYAYDWEGDLDAAGSPTDGEGHYTSIKLTLLDLTTGNAATYAEPGTYTVTNSIAITLANGETIAVGAITLTYTIGGDSSTPVEVGSIIYDDNHVAYEVLDTAANTVAVAQQGTYEGQTEGEVIIPENFVYEGSTYYVTAVNYSAFTSDLSVTAITFPGTITDWRGSSVNTGYAINDCNSVKTITFEEGITELPTNCMYFASNNTSGLTTVYLPSTLTTVGNRAFNHCSALESLYVYAYDVPKLATGANYIYNGTFTPTIYVHCDALAGYQASTAWNISTATLAAFDECSKDFTLYFDPDGTENLTSLSSVTISCEGGMGIEEYAELEFAIYLDDSKTDYKLYACPGLTDCVGEDGNYTSITFVVKDADGEDATLTAAGTYTITIPAGEITFADGTTNSETYTLEYTIEGEKDYSYYFVPTEGVVESIGRGDITLYFNSVAAHRVTSHTPAEIIMTNDEGETVATVQAINGNGTSHHQYALTAAISDPGTYTLTIPAGFYYFDSDESDLNEEITGQWIIEETAPEVSYTLTFAPDGTEELDALSSVTISCEGGMGIGEFGELEFAITKDDEETGYTLYCCPYLTGGVGEDGNYTSITFVVKEDGYDATITAAGTYTITIPAEAITFADGSTNAEPYTLTYTITGGDVATAPTLTYEPATSDDQSSLSTVTITSDIAFSFAEAATLSFAITDYGDATSYMLVASVEAGETNSITFTVMEDGQAATITKAGNYGVDITAGTFTYSNGATQDTDIFIEYYIDGSLYESEGVAITISPSGKTEAFDTITISAEGHKDLQYSSDVEYEDIIVVDNETGKTVAYGTVDSDNYDWDTDECTEIYITLNTTVSAPGEYTITVPAGAIQFNDDLSYSAEGTSVVTIAETGETADYTLTFDPENGGEVTVSAAEGLTSFTVTCEDGIKATETGEMSESAYDLHNAETGDYYRPLTITQTDEYTVTFTWETPITTAGTYDFRTRGIGGSRGLAEGIAEGMFLLGPDEVESPEMQYSFTVVVAEAPDYTLTFNPENGSSPETLSKVVLSCDEGMAIAESDAFDWQIYKDNEAYTDEDGNAYTLYGCPMFTDYVGDADEGLLTSLTFEVRCDGVHATLTEEGTYTITIPAEAITFADGTTTNSDAITLTYYVQGGEVTAPTLVSVDPELESTIEMTDNVFTLTFSGNVKIDDDSESTFIIPAEKGGDYIAFESIVSSSGNEYDTVWTLTVPAAVLAAWPSSEAPFEMEVTAIDEDGNSEQYELDYTVNVVIDRGDKPTVTTVPANNATLSVLDAIEVYCEEGLTMNWYDYSDDDDPVSIGVEDIKIYGVDGGLLSTTVTDFEYIDETALGAAYAALGVRLPFSEKLKDAGTYTIVIPAYLFILGEEAETVSSNFYNDAIEVKVTVDGSEEGQLDYTLDIPDGHIVSDLSVITLTYDGAATLGTGTITVSDGTTTIGATAAITSSSSSATVITITLDETITTEGSWTLTIPEGMFLFGEVKSDAIVATYDVVAGALAAGDVVVYDKVAYIVNDDLTTVTIAKQSDYAGYAGVDTSGAITIPEFFDYNGVTYAVTACVVSAFTSATAITAVDIEAAITNWNNGSTFYNCTGITSVTLGADCANLAESMFYGCSNLLEITIPEGETDLPSSCFNGCSALTTVYLPSTMKSLEGRTFSNCKALTDIWCYALDAPTYVATTSPTFNGVTVANVTLHIYCDAQESYTTETVSSGQTSSNWSSFNIVTIDSCEEVDYTLTFDPADNAELDQLDYMTITCEGGIVLGTTWKDEVLFDVYDEQGQSIGYAYDWEGDLDAAGSPTDGEGHYTSIKLTLLDLTTLTAATYAEPGTYTVTNSTAITLANGETVAKGDITLTYTIAGEQPGYTITFNPELGSTLTLQADDADNWREFSIICEDGIAFSDTGSKHTWVLRDVEDEVSVSLTSFGPKEGDTTALVGHIATAITTPGTYYLAYTTRGTYYTTIPAGTFLLGPDGSVESEEMEYYFTVEFEEAEEPVAPIALTIVPADGAQVESISEIVLTAEGRTDLQWNDDVEVSEVVVTDADGKVVATGASTSDDYDYDEDTCTTITVTLSTEVTACGDYTISIPAKAIYFANDGTPAYSEAANASVYIPISYTFAPTPGEVTDLSTITITFNAPITLTSEISADNCYVTSNSTSETVATATSADLSSDGTTLTITLSSTPTAAGIYVFHMAAGFTYGSNKSVSEITANYVIADSSFETGVPEGFYVNPADGSVVEIIDVFYVYNEDGKIYRLVNNDETPVYNDAGTKVATVTWYAADDYSGDYVKGVLSTAVTEAGTYTIDVPAHKLTTSSTSTGSSSSDLDAFTITYIIAGNSQGEGQIEWTEVTLEEIYNIEEVSTTGYYHYTAEADGKYILHYQSLTAPNFYSDATLLDELTYSQTETVEGYTGLAVEVSAGDDIYVVISTNSWDPGSLYFTFEETEEYNVTLTRLLPTSDTVELANLYNYEVAVQVEGYDEQGYMSFDIICDGADYHSGYFTYLADEAAAAALAEEAGITISVNTFPCYYWQGDSKDEDKYETLVEGNTYSFNVTFSESQSSWSTTFVKDETLFTIVGSGQEYVYSDYEFSSISPAPSNDEGTVDITSVEQNTFTITFTGAVRIVDDESFVNFGSNGGQYPFESITANGTTTTVDDYTYCSSWKLVVSEEVMNMLSGDYEGEDLPLVIAAEDADGRRVQGNGSGAYLEELTFLNFTYSTDITDGATSSSYTITTTPADGATVGHIDKITFACEDNIDLNNEPEASSIIVYDNDGDAVAYGAEWADNGTYEDGDAGWTYPTEVYLTLDTTIVAEGQYTIVVPAGTFVLGDNGHESNQISIVVTVDGSEDVQPSYTMVVAPADGEELTEELSAITVSCDDGIELNANEAMYFQVFDKDGNVAAGVWGARSLVEGYSYSLPLYDDAILTEDVPVTLSDPGKYTFTIPAGAFYLGSDKALSEETTITFTISASAGDDDGFTEIVLDEEYSLAGAMSDKFYYKWTAEEDGTLTLTKSSNSVQVSAYSDADMTETVYVTNNTTYPFSSTIEVEAGQTYYIVFGFSLITSGTFTATFEPAGEGSGVTLTRVLPEEDSVEWTTIPYEYTVVVTADGYEGEGYMTFQIVDSSDDSVIYSGYFTYTDSDACGVNLDVPYYYWKSNSEADGSSYDALYEGHSYEFVVRLRENQQTTTSLAEETLFTITGMAEEYVYSEYNFVSISPDEDTTLTTLGDITFTLTFDGPVTIVSSASFVNFGNNGGQYEFKAITSADGGDYDTVWSVTIAEETLAMLTGDYSGMDLNFVIAAEDEQGRRVHSNDTFYDNEGNTYLSFTYETSFTGGSVTYTVTTVPADGATVGHIDTITFACEDNILNNEDPETVVVYDADGETVVAYGAEWTDNGDYPDDGLWTDATEVYLTLNTTIVAAGTYTIVAPEGTFVLGSNGVSSGLIEIHVTVDGSEDEQPSTETPLQTSPATGDSVESLPYIDVWNPDGILEMDWDDSPYDETNIIVYKDGVKVGACYDYGYDELYDNATDEHYGYRIYFKDDATGTKNYEFVEAGEYKVSFPGNFLMTATDSGVNTYVDAFDVTFTVTGKEETVDYTLYFDPEDNAELDQLDYMTITCEGGIVLDSLVGSNEVVFKVCDEDGNETGFIYDWYYSTDSTDSAKSTVDADGHYTSITLTLMDQVDFVADVITTPGTYLIKQASDQPITLADGTKVTNLSLTYIVKDTGTVEPEPEPTIGAGSIVHDTQGVAYVIQDDEESVYIAKQSPAEYDGDYEGQTTGDLVIGETIVAVENGETYNVTGSKASAFMNATITSIELPGTLATIGTSAFYGCASLASVTLNEGIGYIGDNMFYDCVALTTITVPEGVTSIGSWAFYNCTQLATVYLPSTIDTGDYDSEPIGGSAFRSCTALTAMTILAETPPYVANRAFYETPVSAATLYVPCASVDDYASYSGDYDGWEQFGTIIGLDCPEEPKDYTLTFDPADNAELEELDFLTISCEGGIVLGSTYRDEVLFDVYDEGGNPIGYAYDWVGSDNADDGTKDAEGNYTSVKLTLVDLTYLTAATYAEPGTYTVTNSTAITLANGETVAKGDITLTYTIAGEEWKDTDTYDALCADLSALLAELEAAYAYAQTLETAETVYSLYNTIKGEIESLQAALDEDYNAGNILDADSYEEQINAIEAEISHLEAVAYSEYIYYEYASQITEIWGAIGDYVDWALAGMGDDVYNEFIDELNTLDTEVSGWRNSLIDAAANGELTADDEETIAEAISSYNTLWDNLEGRILSYEYYLATRATLDDLGESLDDVWATIAEEYPDAVDALSDDYEAIAGDIVSLGNDVDEVYNDGELNSYADAVTEQEQSIADAIDALLNAAQNYEAYYQMKEGANSADDDLTAAWEEITGYDDTTIATTLTPDYEDICNAISALQDEIEGYYNDGTAAEHQDDIDEAIADIEARIQKLLSDAREMMYPTGIYTVGADYSNDEVYTLGGQKVNAPNARGIYVINGKKVFVR